MIATTFERSAHLIGAYLDRAVGALRINQAEAHVLVALAQHGPMPIGALHRAFGHKPSTLTNVVDRLERRSLVRRASNPEDRRSVLLQLTEQGTIDANQVLEALNQLQDRVQATVTARDLEGVDNVARALADAVEQLGRDK